MNEFDSLGARQEPEQEKIELLGKTFDECDFNSNDEGFVDENGVYVFADEVQEYAEYSGLKKKEQILFNWHGKMQDSTEFSLMWENAEGLLIHDDDLEAYLKLEEVK